MQILTIHCGDGGGGGGEFYLCVDTKEWNKYFKIAYYTTCRWRCLGRDMADAKYLICALIQQQGSGRCP